MEGGKLGSSHLFEMEHGIYHGQSVPIDNPDGTFKAYIQLIELYGKQGIAMAMQGKVFTSTPPTKLLQVGIISTTLFPHGILTVT